METLQVTWFLLLGVLIVGYAILDGFDLGVGVLHLFTGKEEDRRVYLNAIGPVWDGNEVWLLTGGGALFAAFPIVYATVFSGFYLAFMLLLVALIARAVSMEFRGKIDSPSWKRVWDWCFGLGSLLPAILFGVAFGNILRGLPIDIDGSYQGTFLGLLNPYAILVGVLSLALFVMHGAIYMTLKSEGDLRTRSARVASRMWIVVLIVYAVATFVTTFVSPFLFFSILQNPVFWVLFILLLVSVATIPVWLKGGKYFLAFLSSSAMIAAMIGLSAVSLFPRLVPSSISDDYSLNIFHHSSSELTLTVMLVIALIGMPIVIIYTILVYRVFKGKVNIGPESY
ncbi:MAG: cytochrome d ubiquinol oxidase subunit II [Bacteroidota bacterium]